MSNKHIARETLDGLAGEFGRLMGWADELRGLDPVAWLRFTSVYLGFRTIEEFRDALDEIDPALSG